MKLTPIDTSKWPVAAPGPDERVAMREELARLRRENADMLDITEQRRAEIQRLDNTIDRLHEALKPFAELAGKLDCSHNLVGLLTEADFKRAAEASSILAAERQTIGQSENGK